jgi:alkylhydroperoxidase/carboxymuconolactone decarboxylase family protein YurZ
MRGGLVSISDLDALGRSVFSNLIPGGESRLDAIFRASPPLGELAVGVVYGHLHGRPALDPRIREAVAIAAIAAAGMTDTPLRVHTRSALAAGLAAAEINEVLLAVAAFSGFPRAVQALQTVAEVLEEEGAQLPPDPSPRQILLEFLGRIADGTPGTEPARLPLAGADPLLLADLVAAADQINVITTGPDAALALLVRAGTSPNVILARTSQGAVAELRIANA